MDTSIPADTLAYCRDLVHRADKDRYLASLFAPEDKRPQLLAVYAFNQEIARIRELVSQPAAGELRLQWWREALESIHAGGAADHPVLRALAPMLASGSLPVHAFTNLIEARRFDLYADPMPTLADLEGYLGETSSILIQLAAMILAGPEAGNAADAAGYAGVAYGLTGLLRALPLQRARGQCYVPVDRLAAEGLAPADLSAGEPKEPLERVIAGLIVVAHERLVRARESRARIPPAAMAAFLPVSLVENYLTKLASAGPRVLEEVVVIPQWRRQITLWRMARKRQF